MRFRRNMALLAGLMLGSAMPFSAVAQGGSSMPPDVEALHQKLLTLDTHLDTPANLALPGWDIMDEHAHSETMTQVDVPRMVKGGLDGGFWVIYTEQGALDPVGLKKASDFAWGRGQEILKMVEDKPASFAIATRANQAAAIAATGKRIVYISMENAYPLIDDVKNLDRYHAIGLRMVGIVHFANNQFADSATDPVGPKWNGLSPLGKTLIARANDLGIMVDASHASDLVLDQMLAVSRSPVVLSHSGCKAIYDHPRNIDDDRLRALAKQGGVIQINGYGGYLKKLASPPPEKAEALKLIRAMDTSTPEGLAKRREAMVAAEKSWPADKAELSDILKHLFHAIHVAGIDHVGIGLDWDGGGGVNGLMDVSGLAQITKAMKDRGFTDAEIQKVWSGNILRVMRTAEARKRR